ncbi:MAG: DUF4382 domain-containing protein [Saprospiraceae bacterium]|nr:DUF4382 domain-containing protein [Saprospiraceae bacterium]
MKSLINSTVIVLLLMIPFIYSCSDGSNEDQMEEEMDDKENPIKQGNLSIKITDAPIDDTHVSGAFMTFTGVRVGEETIMLENKVTLDVMALQNGNAFQLLNDSIEIGTYTSLELIVDENTDVEGNQPGCYVLDNNQVKHPLETQASGSFMLSLESLNNEVEENASSEWVVDIDLRKAIRYQEGNNEDDQYTFTADVQSSLRVVDNNHFKIEGKIQDILGVSGDEAIVYVYKKGSFNVQEETTLSSNTDVQFKNAVTSSKVKSDGSFEIHYLDDDEYEIQIISYDKMSDGTIEAKGMLQVNPIGDIDLLGIQLTNDLELNLTTVAVVPF